MISVSSTSRTCAILSLLRQSVFLVILFFAATKANQSSGLNYTPPEPPVNWELVFPDQRLSVGASFPIRVVAAFDSIPYTHLDSLWSVLIEITGPDQSDTAFCSELKPVQPLIVEQFEVLFTPQVPGNYSFSAKIRYGTPALDGRGTRFQYHTRVKRTVLRTTEAPAPQTKSGPVDQGGSAWAWEIVGTGPLSESSRVEPAIGQMPSRGKRNAPDGVKRDMGSINDVGNHRDDQMIESHYLRHLQLDETARVSLRLDSLCVDSARFQGFGRLKVTLLDRQRLIVEALDSIVFGRILLFCNDEVLHLTVSTSLQTYIINGTVKFRDRSGTFLPSTGTLALLYVVDGGTWGLQSYDYTDTDGEFSFWCSQDSFEVFWLADDYYSSVYYTPDHHIDIGDPLYRYSRGVHVRNLGHEPIYFDSIWTQISAPSVAGAWGIVHSLARGRAELMNSVNPYPSPDWTPVLGDSASGQFTGSFFGAYSVDGQPAKWISGQESGYDNPDEWDDPVILHEFSHKLMWEYAAIDSLAGGRHVYFEPAWPNNLLRSKLLSWSEGWANFFQGVMRQTSDYIDTRTLQDTLLFIELERPNPDVPYFLGYDQQDSSCQNPYFDGADVKGAVTEALWDIYDPANDANFYVGGQLWGHNNDYNSSDYWCGIDYIWDVFWDFDPRPNNPTINYCRTIYDFIHGWRTKGYPVAGHFADIMQAHNIAVFLPGDADGSTAISMSDSVYLINWIFAGGPAPAPVLAAGDADGSCQTDINDAVYLINFIFAGGAAPIPGCS